MKKQMVLSSFPSTDAPESGSKSLIEQHPLGSAIITLLADLIVSVTIGWSAQKLLPQFQPEFVTLIVMSVFVALALSVLGWWKTVGFNLPTEWHKVGLVVVPFLIVIGLPFLKGFNTENLGSLTYLIVGYVLTGFMEEGLMRGIVLQMLKPLGVTRSVVISSILFALLHVTNFLFRNPFIVLAQMLGAFVHGIGLGAIRLRTNTIWFVIALHGLHDLFLKFTNFPAIPLDVVQVTLIMLYGIYILRTWKRQKGIEDKE